MRSDQWDKEWIGVIAGICTTALGFFLYALIYTSWFKPTMTSSYFINELFTGSESILSKVLSVSMVAVIPVFFWFNHLRKEKLMKGVLISMFLLAILIIVLLF